MQREEAVRHMTDIVAKFVAFTGKRLPDDVRAKIEELAKQEEEPLAKASTRRWSAIRSSR